MTGTPTLRVAAHDDIAFLAMVVLLSTEERYARRDGWDRAAFHRGLIDDAADQVSGGPEGSTTYVVEIEGRPVGRLRLVRTETLVEIAGLQILPHDQNRGLGSAVVEAVLDEARRRHVSVELDVERDNPDAKRLYRRLGFVDTGAAKIDRTRMIHSSGRMP